MAEQQSLLGFANELEGLVGVTNLLGYHDPRLVVIRGDLNDCIILVPSNLIAKLATSVFGQATLLERLELSCQQTFHTFLSRMIVS